MTDRPLTTGEGNTGLDDALVRVERAYLNEIAEKRQAEPAYSAEEIERVGAWLAGVSFNEWFALAADRDRLREQLDAARQALEDLVAAGLNVPVVVAGENQRERVRLFGEALDRARAALGVEGPAG